MSEMAADMKDTIEAVDNFAPIRNKLHEMSQEKGEWAGIPMPLDDTTLILDKSYPFYSAFELHHKKEEEPPETATVRNSFWSARYRCYVDIVQENTGEIWFAPRSGSGNRIDKELQTMTSSVVWGLEQEHNALMLLGKLLCHRIFKTYLLTGTFLEVSKRSKVAYLFRKLKPTVALRFEENKPARILAALCMHPIGYYENSWAGAMCPTDDVIAHLMLMRGDEVMFWRRSNQHDPRRPEAGV